MPSIPSIGYQIEIGAKSLMALNTFLKRQKYGKHFVLCDENTIAHCLPHLVSKCKTLKEAEVFEIESGENSKTLELCSQLWEALLGYNAGKDSVIINLGGGVISDLGGFIASVYKRGIDFINVPTTLLAMADASVGGKTGIDFSGLKNTIGTITQPKGVYVDDIFLETLPPRQLANGLVEIYKIALISDKQYWKKLEVLEVLDEKVITKSIQLKNTIVKKDPYDKGLRRSLNFGHTIGHAIESVLLASGVDVLHGEAVLAGMICETYLSYKKKLISKNEFNEIIAVLTIKFPFMPLPALLFGEIVKACVNDKKNNGVQIRCALLNGIGRSKINVAIAPMQILGSLEYYNSLLK